MQIEQNFSIRELRPEDNNAIATIIRSALKEFDANKPGTAYYESATDDLFSLFQKKNAAYFIAEMEGEIIGGAGIYPTEDLPEGCCELVKIYLTPKTRGKGIGRALLEECFAAAKQSGYRHVYLESMQELSKAVGMYEKLGFEYLKRPLGNSGHYACGIWIIKEL